MAYQNCGERAGAARGAIPASGALAEQARREREGRLTDELSG